MFYHRLDNRQLHIRRVSHLYARHTVVQMKLNRRLVIDRKSQHALVAHYFYAFLLCTFMAHEAPRATTVQPVFKLKSRTHRVFYLVEAAPVSTVAMRTHDHAEHILQQIQLMRSQVIEIAASRHFRTQTPRAFSQGTLLAKIEINLTGRTREMNLHVKQFAQPTATDNLLHPLEIRKIPTVIGHETRHSRLFRNAVDAHTILIRSSQRLFHIHRFACPHRHDGIGCMRSRRRSHINGIHLWVVYQFLRIRIPFPDAMPFCIRPRPALRTTHHGLYMRPFHFVESRSRLDFRNLATTDESPTDFLHSLILIAVQPLAATTSISTNAPLGNAFTLTAERAGNGAVKNCS